MDQVRGAEHLGFGDWVRLRRKGLWMTQKKLARLVGCAPVTIQKIEEGHRRPSPAVAEVLARQLEIGQDELEAFLHLARTTPTLLRPSRPVLPPPGYGFAGGLPLPPQPLIGREQDMADIQASLLHSSRRLLTLTGPPGVGKTRLAVQVAESLRGAFDNGLYFLPLAALGDPALVLPTLNRCLGLSDSGRPLDAERLIRFLEGRTVLLLLDNFEHLLPAAEAFAAVLECCPGLRMLVTSRSALRLSAEQEWPVRPLPLPIPGRLPTHNPAVQLFAERVRAFDPAFALNARILPAVVEIVTRLEGLPLAIELAAVRLRHQSADELAAGLRIGPLAALGSGPIDGPERQQTLHRAIAWSYDWLDPHLAGVFRRLGIFVGGFEAHAAASVAGAALSDLHTLLDGHLIRREGQRLMLLGTLRAYALERLEELRELVATQDAHQHYFQEAVMDHRQTDLDWYEAEMDNLRAALRTQLETGQTEAALRLALGIYWFWETRGYQHEGLDWFRAILQLSAQVNPQLRLSALNAGSTMAWQSGEFGQSRTWLAEATALSRQLGDTEWEASLLMHQGKVELEQGRYVQAEQVLETALPLAGVLSRPGPLAAVLFQLADVALCIGNLDRAEQLAREGLAICQQCPGLFWEAPLLQVLGLIALQCQQPQLARQHLMRAISLASGMEHRLLLTLLLTSFGRALSVPGSSQADLLRAVRLWSCVDAVRETNGYRWSVAFAHRYATWTAQTRQRTGEVEWKLAWADGRSVTLKEAVENVAAGESA